MLLITMHQSIKSGQGLLDNGRPPFDLAQTEVFASRLDLDDAMNRIRIYQEAFNAKYINARLELKLLHVSEVEDLSPLNRDYFGIELVEHLGQWPDEIGL